MTEDMHEERLQAVEAFGNAFVSFVSFIIQNIYFLKASNSIDLIQHLYHMNEQRHYIYFLGYHAILTHNWK